MYANDIAYTEGSITNVEYYINDVLIGSGNNGEIPEEPEEPIKVADVIGGEKFTETTKIVDDSDDTLWIPGNFGIASDSATDIDDGVVITDGINEFVWIPVDDTSLAEMYNTTTPETAVEVDLAKSSLGEETTTTKLYSNLRSITGDKPGSTSYREPDILIDATAGDAVTGNNTMGINLIKSTFGYDETTNPEILNHFAQDMVNEYAAIFNSIKEYDGFYVGRYELTTGTTGDPTVQKGQPVLIDSWYALKAACNNVISSKFAQCTMIYGNQWDEVLDWFVDTGMSSYDVYENSSSWGNYNNSTGEASTNSKVAQNAGANEAWQANNIYDLAGNYLEWTQEASNTSYRTDRGGSCNRAGESYPASSRDAYYPHGSGSTVATRAILYITPEE